MEAHGSALGRPHGFLWRCWSHLLWPVLHSRRVLLVNETKPPSLTDGPASGHSLQQAVVTTYALLLLFGSGQRRRRMYFFFMLLVLAICLFKGHEAQLPPASSCSLKMSPLSLPARHPAPGALLTPSLHAHQNLKDLPFPSNLAHFG